MLELRASAETVSVPDGAGTWVMAIEPKAATATEGSSVLLTAYEEPADGTVPEPVEPAAPPADQPAPADGVAPADPAEAMPLPAVVPAPAVDPAAYWCVYRTIPFLRTEYLANPSYRHEATMEFLFGQLRPTVIHKNQAAGPVAPPVRPAVVPPWTYDIYLGQIPTFVQRYRPPAIPFGYPLTY
jgi:hypothetical protein